MNYKSLFAILILFLTRNSVAQLTVNNTSFTPTQLVNNILLGPGVVATNVVFTGNSQARGFFKGFNTGLGIDSGIILSTGKVIDAIGPNNSSNQSTAFSTVFGTLLDSFSTTGFSTMDAAVLEFDFIPSSDTAKFNYVFASEEYNEGVCTPYNDVFAFLISGPGISGVQNLAIVPGTSIPVSISSINNGNIGTPPWSPDSSYSWCYLNYPQYFVSNTSPNGLIVEYDGWTTVLTAKTVVIPCNQYHIKLAIADGGADNTWDSGVFIEAGSFNSGYVTVTNQPSFTGAIINGAVVEGCGKAEFVFRRYDSIAFPRTLNFILSGSASQGTDYTLSATNIFFPPGKDTVHLIIAPSYDLTSEANETVQLTLIPDFIICSGWPPVDLQIEITDQPPLAVTTNYTLPACPYDSVSLTAQASGGGFNNYFNYTWNWNGGQTNSSSFTFPVTPEAVSFSVTVTDSCGQQSASAIVVSPEWDCPVIFPNIFSPNGDGVNEFFSIKNLELKPKLKLSIFNRWGKIVFETDTYQNNWDAKGISDGVYYFVGEFEDGELAKGYISVLR
ncbi:MAG: gliding motility-associated C-terminal domain-containing protein [Bacteroidia bacterium]|nr:gliding motility-associated C-terminal domain-containing protein [Bacteroidia bacterium]